MSTRPDTLDMHYLLLRLDSRLPDELVVAARSWPAEGLATDVAQAVAYAAVTAQAGLTTAEVDLLTRTMNRAGIDATGLSGLSTMDGDPVPPISVAPVGPGELVRRLPTLDLTGAWSPGAVDAMDRAAVAAAAAAGGRELWRCWRYPVTPGASPPKRAYAVGVGEGVDLVLATAQIQGALIARGETDPLVRVYDDEAALPRHHRVALDFAALVWVSVPQPEIRVAALSPPGRGEPLLPEPERRRILEYLGKATPLAVTGERSVDVADPTLPRCVPTSVRTDGTWVWSDPVAYYADRHHWPPEPALRAHVARAGTPTAVIDPLSRRRTLAAWHRAQTLNPPPPGTL